MGFNSAFKGLTLVVGGDDRQRCLYTVTFFSSEDLFLAELNRA